MAGEDDNFFSRWSRRKAQVRSGEAPPDEPLPPAPAATVARDERNADASQDAPATASPVAPQAPPPTLDEAAALTPESDFRRFVARGVSPEVRNAAVKKLFADPHFNVMDGLDIYIDDYSQPSPLSAAMMAKMVGAQFLKLVDDPNEVQPPAPPGAPAAQPLSEAPQADTATAVPDGVLAEPGPTEPAPAPDPTQAPHDDHADLQLQPDHAPERESAGRGAG